MKTNREPMKPVKAQKIETQNRLPKMQKARLKIEQFKQSNIYNKSKAYLTKVLPRQVQYIIVLLFSALLIWLTLNMFNIIQLTQFTYIQCVCLYLILAEIEYKIRGN